MSERWRRLVDLIDTPWSAMSEDDRDIFQAWLVGATPHDLFHLLRYVRRGGKTSSHTSLLPVKRGPGDEE